MIKFIYDSCLFYTDGNDKDFGVVGLQTDNTLILASNIFATTKEKGFKEVKLLAKDKEKLTPNNSIKFNRGYIRLTNNNSLFLS